MGMTLDPSLPPHVCVTAVTSVLAIGGIGGLAIGLAGREICENLLNGFLIMSTNPFEVWTYLQQGQCSQ
jgi:hypothetical protein